MELLSQQRFAPATVGELERLHDLWLDLERPETANALLREHRAATLQPLQGDNHLLATASLALSDIQSRLRFDREGGVALLAPAADLMGCTRCGLETEIARRGEADPTYCDRCNP